MNKFSKILILELILLSAILFVFALHVFPIPGTDSRVFIPPALFYSKGLGLYNPLYDITFIPGLYSDTHHYFQFNYYVPFFPMLLGFLTKVAPGIKAIFFVCSIFSVLSLAVYSKIILPVFNNGNAFIKTLIILSVSYLSIYVIPTVGRPESLSCLLCLLLYYIYNIRNNLNTYVYNSCIITLFATLLSTQIVGFYFSFLFFLIFELFNSTKVFPTIISNVIRFFFIVLLFLAILSFSPNGLVNTINGIKLHGTWALSRHDRSIPMFIHYWIFAPLSFCFLVIFVLCGGFYIKLINVYFRKIPRINVLLALTLQCFVLYGFIKFVAYAAPTIYNATQFVFPMTCFLITSIANSPQTTSRKITAFFLFSTFIGGSFFFLRWVILFIDCQSSGKDYNSANKIVNKIVAEHKNVKITQGIWCLLDDLKDEKFVQPPYNKGDVLIIQQVYNHGIEKRLPSNIKEIYNWGVIPKRTFLGLEISASPQSYGFIAYEFQ